MFNIIVLVAFFMSVQALPAVKFNGKGAAHFLKQNKATASWETLKTTNAAVTPSGYFLVHQFHGGQSCSTAETMVLATGTGVCFQGSVNGTGVGSIVYNLGAVGNGYFTINSATFTSLDCSGDATYAPMVIPTTCLHNDGDEYDYVYSYTTDVTPWTSYEAGVVVQ